jgi:hypothetical protein
MSANLKFKPSGSLDVVGYNLYYKDHEDSVSLTKNNSIAVIDLGKPDVDVDDGFIHIELNSLPALSGLDGMYDLGVAAVDDAGNTSPMLVQGLANISLDFLAPNPPTEGSVYFV